MVVSYLCFVQILKITDETQSHWRSCLKKTWTEVIDMDCLALGLAETQPSERKAWSGRLRSAVRLDPPIYYTRD